MNEMNLDMLDGHISLSQALAILLVMFCRSKKNTSSMSPQGLTKGLSHRCILQLGIITRTSHDTMRMPSCKNKIEATNVHHKLAAPSLLLLNI